MVRINRTLQAGNDLKDIADFISKDSKKYTKLQTLRIVQRTKILKSQSHIGRSVPEIDRPDIR